MHAGEKGRQSNETGGIAGGGVEREDSELLLTQAAVDAMPPRKSLVRRPSVVQFAEMQEAAASLAREASQQQHAELPAKPKTKFQVCLRENVLQRGHFEATTFLISGTNLAALRKQCKQLFRMKDALSEQSRQSGTDDIFTTLKRQSREVGSTDNEYAGGRQDGNGSLALPNHPVYESRPLQVNY